MRFNVLNLIKILKRIEYGKTKRGKKAKQVQKPKKSRCWQHLQVD